MHGEVSGSGHAASAASAAAACATASPSLVNVPGALAEGSRAPARSGLDTDGMIIALRFDLGLGLAASSGLGLGLPEVADGAAASALLRCWARRMGRLGSAERARASEKEPPSEKDDELRESESDFQPPPPPFDGSVLDKELLVLDEEHEMRRSAWKPARAEEARDPAEEARVDLVIRISSAMSSGPGPVGLGF